jgi:uncharacterized membrane protein
LRASAVSRLQQRQLVLLHSAMAFGFNTVILALAINTVLGLV